MIGGVCVDESAAHSNFDPNARQYNEAGDRMEPFNLKTERTEGYFDETVRFFWEFCVVVVVVFGCTSE